MIPGAALKTGETGTQKVIGYTRTTTKHRKKSDTTESYSVGIQAWELAALGIAAAVYDFVNGPNAASTVLGLSPGVNGITNLSNPDITGNPAQKASFNVLAYLASGLQSLEDHL